MSTSPTAQAFLARLLDGDEPGAQVVVSQARRRDPGAAVLYARTVAPALRTIGRMWELDEISIADEHMATEIVGHTLDLVAPYRPSSGGAAIVLARPPGDRHTLGERAVCAAFSEAGWAPAMLGAVDPDVLARVVAARRPALVALSVKMPSHLPAALAQIRAVKALDGPPLVLLGGEGARGTRGAHGADRVDDDLGSAVAWADAAAKLPSPA